MSVSVCKRERERERERERTLVAPGFTIVYHKVSFVNGW